MHPSSIDGEVLFVLSPRFLFILHKKQYYLKKHLKLSYKFLSDVNQFDQKLFDYYSSLVNFFDPHRS